VLVCKAGMVKQDFLRRRGAEQYCSEVYATLHMVREDSKHFSALSCTPVQMDRSRPLVSEFYTAITGVAKVMLVCASHRSMSLMSMFGSQTQLLSTLQW
jgi:hypothetical protein